MGAGVARASPFEARERYNNGDLAPRAIGAPFEVLVSKNRFFPCLSMALLLCAFSPAFAAKAGGSAYSVVVSIADQKTYVYEGGALLRTMACSTGLIDGDDDTPLGDYIINESGAKKGEWFYSAKYKEGAKYWVGFIGGTYLFHSVAMDKDGRIIESEAAKLGKPASHGCIRLAVEDAYWFYKTIPSGTKLRIIAASHNAASAIGAAGVPAPGATASSASPRAMTKAEVPAWISAHFVEYKQKYALSCEIALIRMSLGLVGIRTSEDEILSTIPRSGTDPEKAFVCDDINGGRRSNGVIHWNNYGTHPPVLVAELKNRMAAAGISGNYDAMELSADDAALRSLIVKDPKFLGAVLWLVGHPERWGSHPQVNERGMVLGEHVRFLEPALAANGDFRIWDPETGKLIASKDSGAARDLFRYRIVALFAK
jgi:hypothetical protein